MSETTRETNNELQHLVDTYGEGITNERECPKCGYSSCETRTAGVHDLGNGGIAVYCEEDEFQCFACGFREQANQNNNEDLNLHSEGNPELSTEKAMEKTTKEDTNKAGKQTKDPIVFCALCGKYTCKITRHLQRKPHNLSSTIAKNWRLIFNPETHAKNLKICPITSCQQAVVRMDHHLLDKHADGLKVFEYKTLCKQYITPKDWLRSVGPSIDAARTVRRNLTSLNENPTTTTTITIPAESPKTIDISTEMNAEATATVGPSIDAARTVRQNLTSLNESPTTTTTITIPAESPETIDISTKMNAEATTFTNAGSTDEGPKVSLSRSETSDEDEIHQLALEIERDVEWDKKKRKNPHLSLFLSYLTFDLCKHEALAENYLSIVTNAWKVTDSTFSDVTTLTKRSTVRQFYRGMHEKASQPGTIKSYLLAIRIFIRFLVVRSVVRDKKQVQEALLTIEMLSLWFQALRKMVGMRVAELQVIEEQRLLTLTQIQEFLNSKLVSELLRSSDVVTPQQFCGCRDFMVATIQVRTGVRAGPLANMILANIKNATYGNDEMHTITIPKHKTAYVYGAQHICINDETFKWLLKYLEMREKYLEQPSNVHVFTSMNGRPVASSNISACINTAWKRSKVLTESQRRQNATSIRKALVTIQREKMAGQEENLATAMAHSTRVQATHYNVRKTRKQVLEVSKKYNDLLNDMPPQRQVTESEAGTEQELNSTECETPRSILSMRKTYTSEEENLIAQEFAAEIAGDAKLSARHAKRRLRKWKHFRSLTEDQIVNKVKSMRKLEIKKKRQNYSISSETLSKKRPLVEGFDTENTVDTATSESEMIIQKSSAEMANTEHIPENAMNTAISETTARMNNPSAAAESEMIIQKSSAEMANTEHIPENAMNTAISETTARMNNPSAAAESEMIIQESSADMANTEHIPEIYTGPHLEELVPGTFVAINLSNCKKFPVICKVLEVYTDECKIIYWKGAYEKVWEEHLVNNGKLSNPWTDVLPKDSIILCGFQLDSNNKLQANTIAVLKYWYWEKKERRKQRKSYKKSAYTTTNEKKCIETAPIAPSSSPAISLASPSLNDEMLTKYFPEYVGGRRSVIETDVVAKCISIDDPIFHEQLDSFLGVSSYKKLCEKLKSIRKGRQLESYEEIRKSKRAKTTSTTKR